MSVFLITDFEGDDVGAVVGADDNLRDGIPVDFPAKLG